MDFNKDIKVSIVCVVYNHGAYLKDALNGFVNQKTSFRYEIVIHDDASTDDSAIIIQEYVEKYPQLFVPIYQTENQYSKGIKIADGLLYPRCRGKYVAICEGDDYWIDPNKLQKQFDALEAHPDIAMCANGAKILDAASNLFIGEICPRNKECIISTEDVISGGGEFLATNSLFMKKEVVSEIPPFREKLSIDYSIQINGSLSGGIYYLPDIMSVYRANVPGSWTMSTKKNREKLATYKYSTIEMLTVLDEYTYGKYHKVISEQIIKNQFDYNRYKDKENRLLTREYYNYRKKLKGKEMIRFYFKAYLPWLTYLIKWFFGQL